MLIKYYFLFFILILFCVCKSSASNGDNQIITGNILIEGNTVFSSDDILSKLDTSTGKIFKQHLFERDIESLIEKYGNNGYPYCSITIKDFKLNDDKVDFTICINEGNKITIDDIKVVGNKITKDYVVIREISIRKGDVYNQQKIDRCKWKLNKLGFFNSVDEPVILLNKTDSTKAILNISVKDGRTNSVNGVVGYNPPRFNEDKGYFNGLVDVSFRNLFGTGRKADVYWLKKDSRSSIWKIGYYEPYILGFPVMTGIELSQIIQDTVYVQDEWRVILSFPISDYITAKSSLNIETIKKGSVNSLTRPSSKRSLGLGIEFDTRDFPPNPTKGIFYNVFADYGKREYKGLNLGMPTIAKANESKLQFGMEHYYSFFRKQVIAVSIYGKIITSNEPVIPYYELYKFGGARTLRGYREDWFSGSTIGWSNLEYRLLLGTRSRLFTFFDVGYYRKKEWKDASQTDTIIKESKNLPIGYGFGIRVESKLGIIGIDYGWGDQRGLLEGKIHFGMESKF